MKATHTKITRAIEDLCRSTGTIDFRRSSALMVALGGLVLVPAAHAQDQQVAQATTNSLDQVIVTGTRSVGTKATDSVSPISVIGGAQLQKTGQASVLDALLKLEPTFQTQAKGGDLANMVRSATLRGLSANETLVLVNGKRRNTSAYISTSGYTAGAASVDLDLIPTSAIERIEVLKDGAAAQYGSDAIAGVINIILKKGTDGSASLEYGRNASSKINPNGLGKGRTRSATLDKGWKLGDDGYIHLAGEFRDHAHTNQTGPELRTQNSNPALYGGPVSQFAPDTLGDPSYDLSNLSYNAGYTISPTLEVYSFGTFSHRQASSLQNSRPNQLASASTCFYPPGGGAGIPTNVAGGAALQTCAAGGAAPRTVNVGALAKAYYPGGYFIPQEALGEKSTSLVVGAKGDFWGDARWDLSLSYGTDKEDIGVNHTLNYSYLLTPVTPNAAGPNGISPTGAYIGQYNNSQTLVNFDVSKPFVLSFLPQPLDVSVGVETRRDTYEIKQGDTVSWSNGGTQGFIGMTPSDAGKHARREYGTYLDLQTQLSKQWTVGAAARYEHYSDSGSTSTGKLSSRYDFTDAIAVRGTASTGFRAPTLAEQFFTTTTVGPTTATVFLPAGSAAGQLVGSKPLGPEKAKNVSVGMVFTPTKTTQLTVDAYTIKVTNRILLASGITAGSPAPLGGANGLVRQAIALRGIQLPPSATDNGTSVAFFSNGLDLRTSGLDLTASTMTDFGGYGKVVWSAASNMSTTKILRADSVYTPAVLKGLTGAPPKHKAVFTADYGLGPFTATLRVTHYGQSTGLSNPPNTSYPTTNYIQTVVKAAFIDDIELGYQINKDAKIIAGINNFLNKTPEAQPHDLIYGNGTAASNNAATGTTIYPTFTPYGINGAFYYVRATYAF